MLSSSGLPKDTGIPRPLATIEQLFVEAAIQYPEADAVLGAFGSLSYADLLIRAQNIAVVLRRQGIHTGMLVGVVQEQSPMAIASIAGTLLAGATYVPLGKELLESKASLRLMQQTGMSLILCDGEVGMEACSLWSGLGTMIDASRLERETMPASSETRMPPVSPDAIAAVLFRGPIEPAAPGVMISHRAIVRLAAADGLMPFSRHETFLLYPSAEVRASLFEIWGSLLHGATLALGPQGTGMGHEIASSIRQFGVTTLSLPVQTLHELIDSSPAVFSRLRHLIIEANATSGAASPQRMEWLVSHHPGLRIVNTYGSIETAGYGTLYPVPRPYLPDMVMPIGSPLPGLTAHILDSNNLPVRAGEMGQLALAGDGVASGYLNHPQATSQRFLRPHPRPGFDDQPIYLTGDRARRRSDGQIELHGPYERRLFSPEETATVAFERVDVEAMLASQNYVKEAALIQYLDRDGMQRSAAFLAMKPHPPHAEMALKAAMRAVLPPRAYPAHFHYVDSLPHDATGAIDRQALEQRLKRESERDSGLDRAQQETLEQVRGLWLRLLRRVSVDYDEDFFEAGGTQVQMIRMHVELNRRFPGAITMANLSVLTTIRKIYEHLISRRAQEPLQGFAQRGA